MEKHWENENGFTLTTDPKSVDIDVLHSFLAKESYWAKCIPKKAIQKMIKYSLNFSLLSPEGRFIGYSKMITDRATFAFLADVFIDKGFRGRGLGKWMTEKVMEHPEIKNLKLCVLFTNDAHGLYKQFGWENIENTEKIMVRNIPSPDCYKHFEECN